jgi:stage II sporulation protein D
MRRYLIMTVLLLAPFSVTGASNEPTLRVAVVNEAGYITVDAERGGLLSIFDGASREISKGSRAILATGKGGLRVNGRSTSSNELTIRSMTQIFQIGARKFRGELYAVQNGNRILIIDKIPIETYLVGLIASEISSSWPSEAIKAQAVAARTYAMNQMDKIRKARPDSPYDIESTTLDQVYDGAHREEAHVYKIVEATRGQVLAQNDSLIPAYYHSCCGGLTERAQNVWDNAVGPPQVEDNYCARSPKLLWSYQLPRAQFQKLLSTGPVSAITAVPLFDSPRVDTVVIETGSGTKNIKATDLRKYLGYSNLKSTWFEVKLSGGNILFNGRGYGHGVGMCQWGAKGMADEGRPYTDILKFYYPDAELVTLY